MKRENLERVEESAAPMSTGNSYFDNAWAELASMFPPANLPNGLSLDLTQRLSIPRNEKGSQLWTRTLAQIVTVITIGQRNKWLDLHQDYGGNPLLLYVRNEIANAKS